MVGIDEEEQKMISTVVNCLLRRLLIAAKMECDIYAFPFNLPPPNSFTLPVYLKSTYQAICIGSNLF